MKSNRIVALAVAAALIAPLSLVGCGGSQPAADSSSTEKTEKVEETKTEDTTTTTGTTEQTGTTEGAPVTATPTNETDADGAKAAALAAVGLTEADVTDLSVERDTDESDPHFDVEFKSGGMEYSVEVSAFDGTINSIETELAD